MFVLNGKFHAFNNQDSLALCRIDNFIPIDLKILFSNGCLMKLDPGFTNLFVHLYIIGKYKNTRYFYKSEILVNLIFKK